MERIIKIKIVNFQAHKSLEVDLNSHITTITGPSDRGKSAIIRALVWVMTNKPGGDDFIRYGANECSVTLYTKNHTIERIKGKKRNLYILDGIEYKAIKSDVPEDIAKIFNINQNNIQQQFDNIFWFSETAGEVGRNLNSIVDLDIIDYVMSDIISKLNTRRSKNLALEELITKQEKELENEEQIELLQNMISREEKLESILSEKEQKTEKLSKLIQEIESNEKFLLKGEKIQGIESKLENLLTEYSAKEKVIEKLSYLIIQISSIKIPFSIPENLLIGIEKFEELNKNLETKRKNYKKLSELIEDLESSEEDIIHYKKNLKEAEEKFHNLTDNQICPLCGNTFKE